MCSATQFPQGEICPNNFVGRAQLSPDYKQRNWGLVDSMNKQQEQTKSSSQIIQLTRGQAATRFSPTAEGSLPEAHLQAQWAGRCPLCLPESSPGHRHMGAIASTPTSAVITSEDTATSSSAVNTHWRATEMYRSLSVGEVSWRKKKLIKILRNSV